MRRLVVPVGAEDHHRRARQGAREPREQAQALAPGPLEILEDDQRRGSLAAQDLLDRDEELGLHGCLVARGRGGDRPPHEGIDVGDDAAQRRRFVVRRIGGEGDAPQDGPPHVVWARGVGDRLPPEHADPAYQRAHCGLLGEPRFPHAALPAAEPVGAAPRREGRERRREPIDLAPAADEAGCLEEALAGLDCLEGGMLRQRPSQRLGRVERGPVSRLRAPREQPADGRRDRRVEPSQVGLAEQHGREDVFAVEGPPSEEHLDGDDPDGPEVRLHAGSTALEQLRRQVGPGAREVEPLLLDGDAHPEVDDLGVPSVDEHVLGLHVAVDDPAAVQVGEPPEELDEEAELLGVRRARRRAEERAGVRPVLHDEVRPAARIEPVVEDADHVGVAQRRQHGELVRERHQQVVGERGRGGVLARTARELDGDDVPPETVDGAMDHAHSSSTYLVEQHVARADARRVRGWDRGGHRLNP